VAWHGHPRFTADIDFLVRPDRTNAELLVKTLGEFGVAGLQIGPGNLCQPDQILQLGVKPNQIDVITSIAGAFEEAWASRNTVDRLDSTLFPWARRTDSQQGTGRATTRLGRRGRSSEAAAVVGS
jgi:hypothetical protein